MDGDADQPEPAMQDLASAAADQLARPSLPPTVRLLPASAAERVAAGLGDVPYIVIVTILTACTGGLTLFAFNRKDADWTLAATAAASLVVFSLIEPVVGRAPGKRTMDLRIVYERGPAAARWGRWVLKNAPLIVLGAVCFAALAGIVPPEVEAEVTLAACVGAQVLYLSLGLWAYAQTGRPPIYDRLSGARVVRARYVRPSMDASGFEVLPAAPRPVIPVGLEGSPSGGYPPSAGHE